MAVWSALARSFQGTRILSNAVVSRHVAKNSALVRAMSGHRKIVIEPSRWNWHKFKDLTHYYVMVAAIPLGLLVTYCNVFIGPAQLAPIPEGYEPMEWEYYSHPITRFLVKYIYTSEQQEYEKYCHKLHEEYEKAEKRMIEDQVKRCIENRQDYAQWYYIPVTSKYHRMAQRETEELQEIMEPATSE